MPESSDQYSNLLYKLGHYFLDTQYLYEMVAKNALRKCERKTGLPNIKSTFDPFVGVKKFALNRSNNLTHFTRAHSNLSYHIIYVPRYKSKKVHRIINFTSYIFFVCNVICIFI